MFKFDVNVRKSLADELKKVSILGPPIFIYAFPEMPKDEFSKGVIVVASFVWFAILQAAAHIILSIQEPPGDKKDEGGGA